MVNPNELSRRERQIMEALYSVGKATAAELVDLIPDPPSKTAVRTMLSILVDKKLLKYSKRGREFVYEPTRDPGKQGKQALGELLKTYFGGSLESALASHLADKKSGNDADELKRIEKMIRKKRKESE